MSLFPKNKFWEKVLNLFSWKGIYPEVEHRKSVICVAPHTSNWDFPLGLIYYWALGRRPRFMIKKEWMIFPLNYLFKAVGAVPVNRKKSGSVVDQVADTFVRSSDYNIAVTPEGTRSPRAEWKTGFWRIAHQANVVIELAKIDYKRKQVGIFETFHVTGDMQKDIEYIRSRFTAEMAKKPKNFVELQHT